MNLIRGLMTTTAVNLVNLAKEVHAQVHAKLANEINHPVNLVNFVNFFPSLTHARTRVPAR